MACELLASDIFLRYQVIEILIYNVQNYLYLAVQFFSCMYVIEHSIYSPGSGSPVDTFVSMGCDAA